MTRFIPPRQMLSSDKTARQIFQEVMATPARKRFGFGHRLAIVNVDLQKAYTSGEFETSYVTHPQQIELIDRLSAQARAKGLPVVWTRVSYMESAADAGVWGTRTDTPNSLQNIKFDSRRGEFDDRREKKRKQKENPVAKLKQQLAQA